MKTEAIARPTPGQFVASCTLLFGALLSSPGAAQVPVLFESSELVGSHPDYNFGQAIATVGDRLLVGAPTGPGGDSGSLYVFSRSSGSWVQEARLRQDDPGPHDGFGSAMGGAGLVILGGAPGHDVPGMYNVGAVYVYALEPTGWVQREKLTGGQEWAEYGSAVAAHGDRIAIGSPAMLPVSVHIYLRSSSGWSLEQVLTPPSPTFRFGESLAMEGETLAVGSTRYGELTGAVYVYVRSPGGWAQQGLLLPEPGPGFTSARLGRDIELSGDTLIASAAGELTNSGAAYIFERDGTTWTRRTRLSASTPVPWSDFGWAVALEGDDAVVAHRDDDSVHDQAGTLYWYQRSGGTWNLRALLRASVAWSSLLGRSVAIRDNQVFAGARSPTTPYGTVYVFDLDCGSAQPHCAALPNSTGAVARTGALGTLSVSANQLELVADHCPPNQPARFVYGSTAAQLSFGNGVLCIGNAGSGILVLDPILRTSSDGRASRPLDFTNLPPTGQIIPGSTWHFQLWYRDPLAGGATFNTSDGLRMTFCP